MRLTVDTNIMIASLIRDSTCRRILLSEKIRFNTPKTTVEEIEKYRQEICTKAGYSEIELEETLDRILSNTEIVPTERLRPYSTQAHNIMGKIDEDDSQFVACCLATRSDGIWSFDRHFERQSAVRIFRIEELLEMV